MTESKTCVLFNQLSPVSAACWIKTLDPARPEAVETFASGLRRPVDLRFAPDGSLYVLLRNAWVIDDKFEGGTGSLLQIRYAGGVQAANVDAPEG